MEKPMIRVDEISQVRRKPIIEIHPFAEAAKPIQYSGSSAVSTIGPAQGLPKPSVLRPQLAPPELNYMSEIINLYSEMEKIAHLEGQICARETKASLDRLMEIDKQKSEIFRTRTEKMKSMESWGAFQTVVQYIAASSSMMIGSALFFGAAPVAGAFLIAAGGLGLANRAMSDSGMWQLLVRQFTASVDLQIKIASQIDNFCLYLSTALSIAGTIGMYHAGAVNLLTCASRNQALEKCLRTIGQASTFTQLLNRVKQGRIQRSLNIIGSELKTRDADSNCTRQKIQASTANLRKIIELSEKIGESIKQAIASTPI
jgi:hypothetical protein